MTIPNPFKYLRWLKNTVLFTMVAAPVLGYYYLKGKILDVEQRIKDDFSRPHPKDQPRQEPPSEGRVDHPPT